MANSLSMPAVFGDSMVLQRGLAVPVWGKAAAGAKITVRFAGQERHTTTGADGKWTLKLDPMPASATGQTLTVTDGKSTLTFGDVLVGEVWVCSGQSNMEWTTAMANDAEREIAASDFPQIRLLRVPQVASPTPREDFDGKWTACGPATVGTFSAVGYYFGRHLHQTLGVPVGLINSSWGGTPVEAWTQYSELSANPELAPIVKRYEEGLKDLPAAMAKFQKEYAAYEALACLADPGNKGEPMGWHAAGCDTADWSTMQLPRYWETDGMNIDGAVWFRREVEVPAAWAGKELTLELGAIDDFDTTYFNGTKIGGIGKETPNWWMTPRVYKVPAKLVKAGKNLIAVRVFDQIAYGGFAGQPAQMKISLGGADPIKLSGPWLYKIELAVPPRTNLPPAPAAPVGPDSNWAPGGLFNGMILPLLPYAIAGAIWYQGESNADRAEQYRTGMTTLIRNWRAAWGLPDLSFFQVQLANYMQRQDQPGDSAWAELREAQTMATKLPRSGMALAIDVGESADIHPRNKQDVGLRLALAAEAITYGRKSPHSGPMYSSMSIDGNSIRIHFNHADGGLAVRGGGAIKGFAIAGEGRKFVWADAKIDGWSVTVSAPSVSNPVAVRYAWADNPDCNLYNGAGLPAVPFRTDNWPGVTAGRR